jgi:hypothetical protein
VPREISVGDLSPACRELERRLGALEREARAALG